MVTTCTEETAGVELAIYVYLTIYYGCLDDRDAFEGLDTITKCVPLIFEIIIIYNRRTLKCLWSSTGWPRSAE